MNFGHSYQDRIGNLINKKLNKNITNFSLKTAGGYLEKANSLIMVFECIRANS